MYFNTKTFMFSKILILLFSKSIISNNINKPKTNLLYNQNMINFNQFDYQKFYNKTELIKYNLSKQEFINTIKNILKEPSFIASRIKRGIDPSKYNLFLTDAQIKYIDHEFKKMISKLKNIYVRTSRSRYG